MTLPVFYGFGLDVLGVLAASPQGLRKAEIYAAVAEARKLTPAEAAEVTPSGQSTFENRVGWICSWMKKRGWVANPSRNNWTITEAGLKRRKDGHPIELAEFKGADGKSRANRSTSSTTPEEVELTPSERIDAARAEIVEYVQTALLERIAASTPLFFERMVLKLLTGMGYAGTLGRAEHAGRSGDGGIDGILYLDRLHLERVYVQAKRWSGVVGAAVVRDFAGSMDAEAATKGVILSTSTFTADARAYVSRSPKAIRLVDGQELARLMVEFEVGVSRAATIVVPRLDEDFFDGD